MLVKKVWGVYFSGTGTTKRVVKCISQALSKELHADCAEFSFSLPEERSKKLCFGTDELAVLGVPVYAGRVPNLILPYIRDNIKGCGTLAVPIVLFGNRNYDDGLMELRNVLTDNGFISVAAGAFVGEHAFSRTLGAGRPDDRDMALAGLLACKAAEKVTSPDAPQKKVVEVPGCDPLRPYYTPRDRSGLPISDFIKAKPKTDTSKCIKCGLCARICPMGSISADDVSDVRGKCIKCCACIKKCPAQAKYFDHEGFVYHRHELEEEYGSRRAESVIFL